MKPEPTKQSDEFKNSLEALLARGPNPNMRKTAPTKAEASEQKVKIKMSVFEDDADE